MTELVIHLDDTIIVHLKRRAWEEGVPFEEFLRRQVTAVLAKREKPKRRAAGKIAPAPWESEAPWRHRLHCL